MKTNRKKQKQFISFLVAMALIIGMIPNRAFATSSTTDTIRILDGTITKKDLYNKFGGNTASRTDYRYCIEGETGWKRVNYDDMKSSTAAENLQDGKIYTKQIAQYSLLMALLDRDWKSAGSFQFQTYYEIDFKVDGTIPTGGSVKVDNADYQNKKYEVNKDENLVVSFASVNDYIVQVKTGTGAWITVNGNSYTHKAECSTSLSVRYVKQPSNQQKHLTIHVNEQLLGKYTGIESDYVENGTDINLIVTPYNSSTDSKNDKWAYVKSVKVNGEELEGTYKDTVFTGTFHVTADTTIEIEFAERLVLKEPTLSAQKYKDDPQTNMYYVAVGDRNSEKDAIKQQIIDNIVDKDRTYGSESIGIILKYVVGSSDRYGNIDDKWSYFANAGDYYEEIQLKLPKDGDKYPEVQTGDLTVRLLAKMTLNGITAQDGTYDGEPKAGYVVENSASENYTTFYVGRGNTVYSSNESPVNAGEYTLYLSSAFPETIKYNDTVNYGSITLEFSIFTASQNAPSGLVGTAETIDQKEDGKITGVTSAMEYRKENDENYTEITGTELTGLADGTYYIRYKADNNHTASPDTFITLSNDTKLTVTVPKMQTGYTLTVNKTELVWHEDVTLTFSLKEGYSKLDNFAVKVNGEPIELDKNGEYTVINAEQDVAVTVDDVADITVPETEITLGTHKWNKFFNSITFGLFFKDTQKVTITAEDKGSGVDKIYYYLSAAELTEEQVKALTDSDWIEYKDVFNLNPQDEYIIYAKAVDKDNNTKYISSNGTIIIDNIAPVISGIAHGETHYGDTTFEVIDKHIDVVKVDGNPVTLTADGKCTITADGKEHTVVATDKSGNTSKEIKITIITIDSLDDTIDGITVNNVKSSDKDVIESVKTSVNARINSGKTFTSIEQEQLNAMKTNTETLLNKIASVSAEMSSLDSDVKAYDINKVTSDDKAAINGLITRIDALLTGNNLTTAEREAMTVLKATAEDLLKKIADVAEEMTEITDSINSYDIDKVTSDDKDAINGLITRINALLTSNNLTTEEREAMTVLKATAEDLLKKIADVAEEMTEITDSINSYDIDKVTSDDKDAINGLITRIDTLLNGSNLTEAEKEDLGKVKDTATALIDKINKATDSSKVINSSATGDNAGIWLWFVLVLLSGGGLLGVIVSRKRKKYFVK